MKKGTIRFIGLFLIISTISAYAGLYKIFNSDGSVTYSDIPPLDQNAIRIDAKKETKQDKIIFENTPSELLQQLNPGKTKKSRFSERDILKRRLTLERDALDSAKQDLAHNTTRPRTIRAIVINPDGEAYKTSLPLYPGHQRRILELRKTIDQHEKNIHSLQHDLMQFK